MKNTNIETEMNFNTFGKMYKEFSREVVANLEF